MMTNDRLANDKTKKLSSDFGSGPVVLLVFGHTFELLFPGLAIARELSVPLLDVIEAAIHSGKTTFSPT